MARKSRKRQTVTLPHLHSETAGYIRLSVTGKGGDDSIENQKKVIEAWARENQHPISRWYIDAGWSGRTFYRPMFRELIADIELGEVDCVVVKDLSRLGRDHIAVGYYLEVFFPMNCVRFVSINDDFDTVNGLTDQSHPHGARIRIPIKNAFNEQVAVEIKQKVEATLQMKIDRGTFVGPRAPFGYQKSEANHDQLVPDPIASITVRKIFELAANGTGVTGIVRYLNEKGLPTPIQYARSNGLTGSFADGTGDWNSRSVKYILTNRTYTGMLIQGKEKRVVKGTHEPLVDVETFDRIQSEFKARSFNISLTPEASENVFKGKVICACCGGKMQRKRGTNHADWYFFTCISKNRLGADKCTGMYAREEDVLSAVYYQLKQYIDHHFITKDQYKQEIQRMDSIIEAASLKYEEATDFSMKQYEKYVMGEGSKEAIAAARPAKEQAEAELNRAIADKEAYEKQYQVFCKLLKASRKGVPLSEIIDCIERIVVDVDRKIIDNYGKQPIEDGIDVVAVDSLAFQRYCELASLISKPLTVVTDNDGNAEAVRKRYEKYTGLVTLCVESDNTLNTLEPSVLAANLDTFESFKSIIYLGKDIESRDPDSIKSFMIGNKTDWSMRVFTSKKKINYPSYILKAIGIDSENVGDRDE